jgi:hypothetical protein
VPYFPDLSPCTYFGRQHSRLIAIGWLDPWNEYQKGGVSRDFLSSLVALLEHPWQPFICLGIHYCSFCQLTNVDKDHKITIGVDNLFIPGKDQVYVAPSMITHYIDSHDYQPPLEFQEAVMFSAGIRRMDYEKKLEAFFPDCIP